MNENKPPKWAEIARFKVPSELRLHVDKRIKELGYGQAEYMRHLIRQDAKQATTPITVKIKGSDLVGILRKKGYGGEDKDKAA